MYSKELLNKVKRHLKRGGVIAYPTESCYGFGCDPFNYKAIDKLIKIKQRTKDKGLIVIAGSIKQLQPLIKPLSNSDIDKIGRRYWPGPYSLILPVKPNMPSNLTGCHSKLAVRVSKHKLVQQLCSSLKQAIVSTSANKSGCPAIKSYRECQRQFGNQVMILPGLIGFAKKPSTIIDWETQKVLR